MKPRRARVPQLYRILNANTSVCQRRGDFSGAAVELYDILRAAWRRLTPEQRLAVFRQPELRRLARQHPEYAAVYGHLASRPEPTDQ